MVKAHGRGPDPSSKATLWMKALHEGALATLFIVRKIPQSTYSSTTGLSPLKHEELPINQIPWQTPDVYSRCCGASNEMEESGGEGVL